MADRSWSPLRMGIVAVLVAAIVAGFVARIAAGGDDEGNSDADRDTGPTSAEAEAQAWETDAEKAVEPLVDALPPYVEAASAWTNAGRPMGDGGFVNAVALFVAKASSADRRVAELSPGPERAGDLLRTALGLYIAAGQAHTAAAGTGPSDLRAESDLLATRLRTLGDRVYDRSVNAARAAGGEPLLFEDVGPDVRLNMPPAVPDWNELGVAPGSVLPTGGAGAGGSPPTGREVEQAVTAGDVRALGRLAGQLVAATPHLPPGEVPDESTARLGLGLLVLADACRAAQLAALLPNVDGLDAIATDLAGLGSGAALAT